MARDRSAFGPEKLKNTLFKMGQCPKFFLSGPRESPDEARDDPKKLAGGPIQNGPAGPTGPGLAQKSGPEAHQARPETGAGLARKISKMARFEMGQSDPKSSRVARGRAPLAQNPAEWPKSPKNWPKFAPGGPIWATNHGPNPNPNPNPNPQP